MTGSRNVALALSTAIIVSTLGCSSSTTHTPTEMHDQKGEHLNYPAGGPNSPDYKKSVGKTAQDAPKEESKDAPEAKK